MPELKNVLFEEPGQRKLVARSFIKPESVKPEKRHHRRHRFVKQLRFSDFSPMEFMDDTAALPLDQMAQIIGDEYNSPRWETLRARAGKLPANVDFYLFRHESGVTKKDLGELVGVSQALISEYEVRRAVSDPTTTKRIADVFCREVEEVFPDADISLEVPMSSVGLVPEQIVHDKQQDPFDEVCEYHLRVDVDDVLRSLTHRERRVIQLRFGLDDGRERSLDETGKMFGVSGVRIGQIELKALRKLRHPSRSKKLADYFNVSGEAKNLLLGKLPWLVSARVREILADPNYQSADYEKEYPERVNLWIGERDYTDSVKKALADLRKLKQAASVKEPESCSASSENIGGTTKEASRSQAESLFYLEQIAKLIDPEYLRWWREKELVYYRSLFEFLSKGALPNEARCLAKKEQEIWLAENLTPVLQKYPGLAPLYR